MVERPQRLVAHTPPEGTDDWHWLDDHLRAVARMAAEFAEPFGASGLAWWAGIYHDLGKAHPDFQDYLWKNHLQPGKKHQTVDHKTSGALKSREVGGDPLARIIHAHHGGLTDTGTITSRLRGFIASEQERLHVAISTFQTLGLVADGTTAQYPASPPPWLSADPFELEFLMRMVFSALVDADALDTEAHWNSGDALARGAAWPTIADLHDRFMLDQARLEASVASSDESQSPVNRIRREVYAACLDKAERPTGFFRMTVPTGGGKTRSGLAFALRHAMSHNLRRIIVAVPFLTITEQTADVYRRALGDDALIEHHSGLETAERRNTENPDNAEALADRRLQLVTQNWDAPLIVTTTVQLFESLFTNRTSKARKLHNLAGSVIILDEIQTIPAQYRGPIFDVLRELVAHYNVTVVLSTATQPVLDTIAGQIAAIGDIVELAPEPERLFAELRRVTYEFPCLDEPWDWSRVVDELEHSNQALVIVNTISDAAALFAELDDEDALHLSTRMCGAHRRTTLSTVRQRLRDGEPCRVVSTQLVEAGVDLDFPVVLRALAPLDRIVQAAGRCNREGKLTEGRVVVFQTEDNKMPPGIYRQGADETKIMLRQAGLDMHHPGIFLEYFARLYSLADADRKRIQALRRDLNFASVDESFSIIEDDSFPVFVDYQTPGSDRTRGDDPAAVLEQLEAYERWKNGSLRSLMRRAQPWLVSVRTRERNRLMEQGIVVELVKDVVWRWNGVYDSSLGIKDIRLSPEGLFI